MRISIYRAVAALSAAAAIPARAQAESPQNRYLAPVPHADPAFVAAPVPPPDKSYLIPAVEVFVINTAIWTFNYTGGRQFAQISWKSVEQNFSKGWIVDTDDFFANQLMHPIHGNLNFNAARSSGLNFYESFLYAFAGSFMWEQFMEIQPPSLNDQVMTPGGGSLLGEVLYRMSRLVLDSGGYNPSGWRQLGAFVLSPIAGGNRLMFKDRFRGELLLPKSWMAEFRFGAVVSGNNLSRLIEERRVIDIDPSFTIGTDIIYGIPGTPGLELDHPFDHFTLAASLAVNSDIETRPTAALQIRGLLLGETIWGEHPDGLWGLFVSYDFIAPAIFRVAGFGFGPGISLRKSWDWFDLYGTAVAEALPWAGGGSTVPFGVRDYHYGPGGSVTFELRGHVKDRVIARLSAREYWLSGSYAQGESENITYAQAQLTLRVIGAHCISGAIDYASRLARRALQHESMQRGSNFTLFYTILQGW